MFLIVMLCTLTITSDVNAYGSTYTAAVLEYSSQQTGTPLESIQQNAKEYITHMSAAKYQGADIIVFPEDGLTGWDIDKDHLELLSTELPNPSERVSPCVKPQHQNYAKYLAELSCASRNYKIYSVINLIEWEYSHNKKKVYYNCNIVFDRNGVVIAKYRKINLLEEPDLKEGDKDQVSTFETDFGVKFGMFVCFDILFKYPAIKTISDTTVTDIVYSAAWFSELPFFHSLSVQHGFAKSNGVNLLASGLNNPGERNGGSGIYLHNGRIEDTYLSGHKSSKLIVKQVPKINVRKDLSNGCQASSESPKYNDSYLTDVAYFRTKKSDLSLYTFKSVNLNEREISTTVCSKGSSFCCSFNITIDKGAYVSPNYVYKLTAFNGVLNVIEEKNIGLQICGLVACLNENDDSCGESYAQPPIGITFKSISVRGGFEAKHFYGQPATLNYGLVPSTDYMYCSKTTMDEQEISMTTTKPHHSLLTFGIVGRVYQYDDSPVRLIGKANTNTLNIHLLVVLLMLLCAIGLEI